MKHQVTYISFDSKRLFASSDALRKDSGGRSDFLGTLHISHLWSAIQEEDVSEKARCFIPRRSMYAIYAYTGVVLGVNVGIYGSPMECLG